MQSTSAYSITVVYRPFAFLNKIYSEVKLYRQNSGFDKTTWPVWSNTRYGGTERPYADLVDVTLRSTMAISQTDIGTTCRADIGMFSRADIGIISRADIGTSRADIGTSQADIGTIRADIGCLVGPTSELTFGTTDIQL